VSAVAYRLQFVGAEAITVMTLHDPSYYERPQLGAWDRVREALRRDWQQTLHDLSTDTHPNLNQSLADTLKQAVGAEPIPPSGRPNPRRFSGRFIP